MSKKIEVALKSAAKADEVLRRYNELNKVMDRLAKKVEAAKFSVGKQPTKLSAQQMANYTTGVKRFGELQQMHRVLKNKLAAMGTTKPGTPEAIRVYDKILITIDRCIHEFRELDKLYDEAAALRDG